jgi:DNA-binding beta-propeller fold protein YncE
VETRRSSIAISNDTLEFPVADGAGRVFDNIETTGEIAVIDVKNRMVSGRLKFNGCETPSGLAYVSASKLLIAACGNGVAKIIQADTGKEVASVAIGHGPDAVIYDPFRKMAFIPCGTEGLLEVISLADQKHISVVQHVQTQQGSRTGTVDPSTGRVYLMASKPDLSAGESPRGRVPRLSGSWEVLIVGP